ncbi:MAG TPA: TIGR03905 family TSCPD domain-containing protein [Firmicutes bacterium]|nr:TIGR03905 family TSCPD domain-containing protein [Bacillota bacterium]
MAYEYRPRGVCSQGITFELEDGVVRNVRFTGGCSGNTQGVARLVDGMPAEEAVKRLSGIRCGMKPTSCPDQLARAIKQAMQQAEGRR